MSLCHVPGARLRQTDDDIAARLGPSELAELLQSSGALDGPVTGGGAAVPARRPPRERANAPPPGVDPALWDRQVQMELAATDLAVEKYVEMKRQLASFGKAAELKLAQRLLLQWYEPLLDKMRRLQADIREGVPGTDRRVYGPYVLQLSPEKLTVLTMHELVNASLTHPSGVVKLLQAALQIGAAVQAEVNVQRLRKRKLWQTVQRGGGGGGGGGDGEKLSVRKVNRVATNSLEGADWGNSVRIKVGCALVLLLKDVALVQSEGQMVPAFSHEYVFQHQKKVGVVRCHPEVSRIILDDMHAPPPRHLPMLVPPRPWTRYDSGGYYQMESLVMRTRGCQAQSKALARAGDAPKALLDGLTALGELEWSINRPVYDTLVALWEQGGGVAGLPPRQDAPVPEPLGPDASREELKEWRYAHRRSVQMNADLHSLRCDTMYKIQQAGQFVDDSLYFPYNIDFRGRAYPIPPHFNHLGADTCRGLLLFAEARPLGRFGLRWIKIHLANLFGVDKVSFDDRERWSTEHEDRIRSVAADPLADRWWVEADDPFQALATCIELAAAVASPDPEEFMSRLPVHQDGSCNGLQHYAALGRDRDGARQVNLLPSPTPQDVYGGVADRVATAVALDARRELGPDASDEDRKHVEYARMLDGKIDRKVVKQTVMTSVYGVTFVGARRQIQRQLEAKFEEELGGPLDEEMESTVYHASSYVAHITMRSMGEVFTGARDIMDWLALLAKLVASEGQAMSWITPLGLPVVQPYRRAGRFQVRTLMQSVVVVDNSDDLPVSTQRQRSAFPPNFVHSLDSTHMLMTAMRCQHKGLAFTAVHDSYWTHAGTVESMNAELRDAFIELYDQPILENLLTSLQVRYPSIEFPPIPRRGDLDLNEVRESDYFFS